MCIVEGEFLKKVQGSLVDKAQKGLLSKGELSTLVQCEWSEKCAALVALGHD